eukprot:m51a1_g14574 putative transcription initiation factor iib (366) ;mRNA; f:1073852-1075392
MFAEDAYECPPIAGPVPICPETGEPCNYVDDARTGHTVCTTCGGVAGGIKNRFVDLSAEWRHFADTPDTKDRLAGSQDRYLTSTSTCIAPVRGQQGGGTAALRSLHHQQKFNKQDKHIMEVWSKLKQYAAQLTLSEKTISQCQDVYYEYDQKRGTERGCRMEALVCAAIFIGCKKDGAPRSIREISRATGINERDIKKGHRLITRFVHDVPSEASEQGSGLIGRMCYNLRLPYCVRSIAEEATRAATELVEGRTPATVASGALLYVLTRLAEAGVRGIERTEKEIAEVAGITQQTVRSACMDLRKARDSLVADAMTRASVTIQAVQAAVAQGAGAAAPGAPGAQGPSASPASNMSSAGTPSPAQV